MGQEFQIEIYTLDYCTFCKQALMFFAEHNLEFTQHKLDGHDEGAVFEALGKKLCIKDEVTVPQIIVNNVRIGGYSDMMELWEKGKIFR
jgi:glutaredoxin